MQEVSEEYVTGGLPLEDGMPGDWLYWMQKDKLQSPSRALTISKREREKEGLGRELSLQREDSVMTLLFLLITC